MSGWSTSHLRRRSARSRKKRARSNPAMLLRAKRQAANSRASSNLAGVLAIAFRRLPLSAPDGQLQPLIFHTSAWHADTWLRSCNSGGYAIIFAIYEFSRLIRCASCWMLRSKSAISLKIVFFLLNRLLRVSSTASLIFFNRDTHMWDCTC